MRSLFHRPQETIRAVDAITFQIEPGERVGFLGPNGAGKTTTLKVLAGLLHPTSGNVRVLGFEPKRREDAFLRSIALVLGQKQQLIWDLPPSETFELNAAIYDVDRSSYKRTLTELVDLLQVGDVMKRPTRQLSLGERMKCEFLAALLHRPRVLFLDEPTIGLDVSMQAQLREFIRHYNEREGATLLLTSHYMEDVLRLCPRVIVIDKGKLVFDGKLEELVHRIQPNKRLVLRFTESPPRDEIEKLGTIVEENGPEWIVQVPMGRVREVVAFALGSLKVGDFSLTDPPLEDVMRDLFKETAEKDAHAP